MKKQNITSARKPDTMSSPIKKTIGVQPKQGDYITQPGVQGSGEAGITGVTKAAEIVQLQNENTTIGKTTSTPGLHTERSQQTSSAAGDGAGTKQDYGDYDEQTREEQEEEEGDDYDYDYDEDYYSDEEYEDRIPDNAQAAMSRRRKGGMYDKFYVPGQSTYLKDQVPVKKGESGKTKGV